MRKTILGIAAVLLLAAPARGQAFSWDTLQIIGGSPDVRHWSETTQITKVKWSTAGMSLDFDAKAKWPDVTPAGWAGALQYTIWVAQPCTDHWCATGAIQVWRGLQDAGGDVTALNQIGSNWIYFVVPPLHQPAPGEQIGIFVTAGNQRRADDHLVTERSNLVTMPFPGAAGGSFSFTPVSPVGPDPSPAPTQTGPTVDQFNALQARVTVLEEKLAAAPPPPLPAPTATPPPATADQVQKIYDMLVAALRNFGLTSLIK